MKQHLQGSISLLLALILPAMSLLFILGLAYGERRLREADFARAVTAAAEKSMASYDRGLWLDFGLWGVEEAEMHLEECFKLAPHAQISYSLKNTEKTLEEKEIKSQILRFMRLRAPAFLALDLEKRMHSALEGRRSLAGGKLEASLREAHRRLEADRKFEEGREGVNSLNQRKLESERNEQNEQPLPLPPVRKDSEHLEQGLLPPGAHDSSALAEILPVGSQAGQTETEGFSGNQGESMSELGSEHKSFLEGLIFSFSKGMLPVYHALGSEDIKPDEAFSPSCIEGLAGKVDLLLDKGLRMDSERLALAEYALRFFPAALWTEHDATHLRRLRTPDGRLLGDMAKERPLEVEQIITGVQDPQKAEERCEKILLGLRFLPQLLAAAQSPSRQATYLKWSQILSVSLALLSLGEVDLPPETLRYFVQAAHCFYLAKQDVKLLKRGESVFFWPSGTQDESSLMASFESFFYRDYLRLLLLALPEDKLTAEMLRLIKRQYPGEYLAAWQLECKAKEGVLCRDLSYIQEEP